jgi:7-cyano-7-deazaguanine synthase
MKRSSICVLVSGGLDSVALAGHLSQEYGSVYPVFIQQGLAWETIELYWLRRFLRAAHAQKNIKPLTLFELPMADLYGRHWSLGHGRTPGGRTPDKAVYLPGRNPLLTIKPAVFCAQKGISVMAVGSLNHNPFPDATPAFFKLWSKALSQALGKPLQLSAPFRHLSKEQVIRLARQWPLHLSFSCLAPQGKRHCGRCNKCAERRLAFKKARVPDETSYAR